MRMKIKNLSTRKTEVLFIIGGIGMVALLILALFFLVRSLANRLEQAYGNNAAPGLEPQINYAEFDRIMEKAYPNGAPSGIDQ